MKRFFAVALAVVALSATSCNKWLDINTNPNYLADADASTVLPTVELTLADKVGYDINLYGYFWAQYVNQNKNTNQYYTIMTYNVTNSTFTGVWSYEYTRILPSIYKIETDAKADGKLNFYLEARVLLAYNMYLLTSLYGPVAYTDSYCKEGYATTEANMNPAFDSDKDTQANIISILEAVRDLDIDEVKVAETNGPSDKYDMIFAGDMDSWLQFANTLYLKVLMRDFETNKDKITKLLAEDNFLAEDCAFDKFEDSADKSSPLYESDRRQLNTTANIRACSDILGVLDSSDPRLEYYYEGGCVGASYGTTTTPAQSSRLALSATDPVYFGTVDEVEFLKAEAYARLDDATNAQACYEAALTAAFKRVGCGSAAAGFISGTYAFTAGTVEEMVEQIINQKWASNVRCMPIEAWFDINRTGYPTRGITITAYSGVLGSGNYPYRFLISKTSSDYNTNAPETVSLSTKMWWHK